MLKRTLYWLSSGLSLALCSGCHMLVMPILLLYGDKYEYSAVLYPAGVYPTEEEEKSVTGGSQAMGKIIFLPHNRPEEKPEASFSISDLKPNTPYCVTYIQLSCRDPMLIQKSIASSQKFNTTFTTAGSGEFSKTLELRYDVGIVRDRLGPDSVPISVMVHEGSCTMAQETLVACGQVSSKLLRRAVLRGPIHI